MILEIIGVVLGLEGTYLIIRKNRWGYMVWVGSNIVLAYVFSQKGLWFSAALFVLYIGVCFYGFYEWSKEGGRK